MGLNVEIIVARSDVDGSIVVAIQNRLDSFQRPDLLRVKHFYHPISSGNGLEWLQLQQWFTLQVVKAVKSKHGSRHRFD